MSLIERSPKMNRKLIRSQYQFYINLILSYIILITEIHCWRHLFQNRNLKIFERCFDILIEKIPHFSEVFDFHICLYLRGISGKFLDLR